ncbi:MAG TPA: AAA family ATPase [Kofleriaceae bacterium]|nr:AAA family ATPase [Kofleriaceae bacterium]
MNAKVRKHWLTEIKMRAELVLLNESPYVVDGFAVALNEGIGSVAQCPMQWLRTRLGLTASEERVVWLLIAHAQDAEVRQLLRSINTEKVTEPTMATILAVGYGSDEGALAQGWQELDDDSRLMRFGLVERADGGDANVPEYQRTYKASRRAIGLAMGDAGLPRAVVSPMRLVHAIDANATLGIADATRAMVTNWVAQNVRDRAAMHGQIVGEPTTPVVADAVIRAVGYDANGLSQASAAAMALPNESVAVLFINGKIGTGKRSLALHALAQTERAALLVDAASLATDEKNLRTQLREIVRESLLQDAVIVVRNVEAMRCSNGMALVEAELLATLQTYALAPAMIVTSSALTRLPWHGAITACEMGELSSAALERVWQIALPGATFEDARFLVDNYPLAPALIRQAGAAIHRNATDASITIDKVRAGIRSVVDDRLAGLARRIETTQTWEDCVLADEAYDAVVGLLARVRERRQVYEQWGFARKVGRGLGIAALLSGPPGTGKTMVAGLIARELGLDLYQVDASKISSKWIGETEANLAKLFDAAEAGHAILLFDEADTIFGKRTEVKSSNDRHANSEVNYLLQRLESFRGVVLLTTNHENAMDAAFARRLSTHIRFALPEVTERAALWQACLPADAPCAQGIDTAHLAERFAMSGGYIRNAVLRAAFLAAHEKAPIAMAHLVRGGQQEYASMGKVVMG